MNSLKQGADSVLAKVAEAKKVANREKAVGNREKAMMAVSLRRAKTTLKFNEAGEAKSD